MRLVALKGLVVYCMATEPVVVDSEQQEEVDGCMAKEQVLELGA